MTVNSPPGNGNLIGNTDTLGTHALAAHTMSLIQGVWLIVEWTLIFFAVLVALDLVLNQLAKHRSRMPPSIVVDNTGIRFKDSDAGPGFTWNEIDRIWLNWDVNIAASDAWLAEVCDTWWHIYGGGRLMSIRESGPETNNKVLIPALRRNLPGFKFSIVEFHMKYRGRRYDIDGGGVKIWQR